MFAAAAVVWITLDVDVATPPKAIGRGWTLSGAGEAAILPLFVYPDYRSGLEASGAFRIAHAMSHHVQLALVGRAGATYVDDWRRVFEGRAELAWRQDVELRAGLRHDDRLSREGALAGFRDPTGRMFLGASVYPIQRGRFSAGAAIDYERALPGAGRLPSGVSVAVVGRARWPR